MRQPCGSGTVQGLWQAAGGARGPSTLAHACRLPRYPTYPPTRQPPCCRKYAKVEKIPGGAIEDSRVLRGVMFEKDVVVPARMRRWAPLFVVWREVLGVLANRVRRLRRT